MDKIDLSGYITEAGVLHIQNRPRLQEWAQQYPGKQVVIRIEKRRSKRSTPQNRYYFGIVVAEVRLGFLNIGYELTAEETHYFLKERFNSVTIENKEGISLVVPGTTTTMTKSEFSEYIEKIARFAAEFLSVKIPAASENLEMKFE